MSISSCHVTRPLTDLEAEQQKAPRRQDAEKFLKHAWQVSGGGVDDGVPGEDPSELTVFGGKIREIGYVKCEIRKFASGDP